MANGAVSFLLNKLSTLLNEERHLLGCLEGEVESIQREMMQVNEFLNGFIQRDDSNPIPEWIGQLRNIAYDLEDVLDKYMFQFQRYRDANGVRGHVKKAYASIKDLIPRHLIACEIQAIKCRLQSVSESQRRYKYMNANIGQRPGFAPPKIECYDGRGDALFLDNDEVVGIEKPMGQLLEWIHSRDDGLEVISVVGMGGLGKTTLVKKVYDDESVKTHFDHHVKIIVSEYEDNKHMLASLIKELVGEIKESPPKDLEGMSVGGMKEFIFNFLKAKKYIIILDDVWDESKWDAIESALPKRGTRGCVVITTRCYNIANIACSKTGHMYELKPLPEKVSWELFHKKAFPGKPCPHYIRTYAENILRRCQGLPLAISIIGGLLATKEESPAKWEMFARSLGQELKGGGSLEKLWSSLITLSYNDLPYYLKYCYIYLGIFPKDSLLEKETIIRLWVAEGFVQPKQEKTMEEVAVDYLGDLVSRSLIQLGERDTDGRARTFRIHDLLLDYIISKAGEHNIVTISNGHEMQWPSRVRRLVIQKAFNISQDTHNLDCLRSLILLSPGCMEPGVINELVGRCRLLKVLELRGAPLETIPNDVFKLYYLKHLSLRNTMVKFIPKSIKYLVNLETLDLKKCGVTELPVEIRELHRLRHLLVYNYTNSFFGASYDCIQSCKAPCDIGKSLSLLLKLHYIDANECGGMKMVTEVGNLTQLRRLGIAKLRSEDGKDLCSSIANLINLRSLFISSVEEGEKLDLDYNISLPFLRVVVLHGYLEKVPEWIRCLNSLTRLVLCWSKMRKDPLNILQDLPNLSCLCMHGLYVDGLRFKTQGFQKLKELSLAELKFLKRVTVEKGSLPNLEKWGMRECKMMAELPQGIEHLPHLQALDLWNMGDEFLVSVFEEKRGQEGNNWRLDSTTKVRFYDVGDDGYSTLDLNLSLLEN